MSDEQNDNLKGVTGKVDMELYLESDTKRKRMGMTWGQYLTEALKTHLEALDSIGVDNDKD